MNKLIPKLLELDADISPNPKDALFRINRDLRFSKDKTPYHTLLKAGFSPNGKKSKLPGFYLGISAEKIHVGGGLFNLDGASLKAVRNLIAENTSEFIDIITADSFVSFFQSLKGETSKRLDQHLQSALSQTPYIAHKQFYAMRELPLSKYLNSDQLTLVISDTFREINPLNKFLKKAFQ